MLGVGRDRFGASVLIGDHERGNKALLTIARLIFGESAVLRVKSLSELYGKGVLSLTKEARDVKAAIVDDLAVVRLRGVDHKIANLLPVDIVVRISQAAGVKNCLCYLLYGELGAQIGACTVDILRRTDPLCRCPDRGIELGRKILFGDGSLTVRIGNAYRHRTLCAIGQGQSVKGQVKALGAFHSSRRKYFFSRRRDRKLKALLIGILRIRAKLPSKARSLHGTKFAFLLVFHRKIVKF